MGSPTLSDHLVFFGVMAVPVVIMTFCAIFVLKKRIADGHPPQLSLIELVISPIYFAPSFWFVHTTWINRNELLSDKEFGFSVCSIICCFIYQLSGAASCWALLRRKESKLNWLFLMIGAYGGILIEFCTALIAVGIAYLKYM